GSKASPSAWTGASKSIPQGCEQLAETQRQFLRSQSGTPVFSYIVRHGLESINALPPPHAADRLGDWAGAIRHGMALRRRLVFGSHSPVHLSRGLRNPQLSQRARIGPLH